MLSNCREIQSGWTSDSVSDAAVRGKAMAVSLIGGTSPPDPLVTTKYESSGAMSAASMRLTPPTRARLSSHSRLRQGSSSFVAVSMTPMP